MSPHSFSYEFNKDEGLFCNDNFICDFNIEVTDKKTLKDLSTGQLANSYLVNVSYTDGRPPLSKWIDNPKKINYFELFEVNDSFLTAEAKTILVNKLLNEITHLPSKVITVVPSGLNIIREKPVYIIGTNIIWVKQTPEPMEHLQLQNVRPLSSEPIYARTVLDEKAAKYLSLLPGITEPLFFYSLFAVVKPFVELLQIHCGFLLALIAPSGQLKTTLARFYCLWLKSPAEQEVPIHSGIRTQHILGLMDTLSGHNILIDDLRKSRDTNAQKRQESRLDIISRHVDSQFNCANVILTGETMDKMGIFSCIDRIFQIHMPVMDAKQVKELQNALTNLGTNVMPNIALEFARVLMHNYDSVLNDIKYFYDNNILRENEVNNYATRTYRHTLFIRLTEFLFTKYFCEHRKYKEFQNTLNHALDLQVKIQTDKLMELRFSESHRDYIWDFYNLLNVKKLLKIYTNKYEYSLSDNAVFMTGDRICITSFALKNAFFNYYEKYIPPNIIVEQFHKEGVLEEEARSKGYQKNINGQKSYVINMNILVLYLVRHNYSVSEEMKQRYLQENQVN